MTIIIHEGKKVENLSLKDGTAPEPISTDNAELKIVETIIKHQLEDGETDKRKKIVNKNMGVSEQTSIGVCHL